MLRRRVGFGGFWCRRCGGRVLEGEIYAEADLVSKKASQQVELTCLLCSRNYRVGYQSYIGLLNNIERIILKKKAIKNREKQILSQP
jgi:hypothetical protein